MGFERNVFVNCPFDDQYLSLLRPLLFTIKYLGFKPRIALEALDSAQPRIEKIISLVEECRLGIHDLSRIVAKKKGEYFRLNMPLELGIDIGCRVFGGGKWSRKRCLILEAQRYRYQAAISDLSNSDIAVHKNKPVEIVHAVRNWLNAQAQARFPGPANVWGAFNDFMADNYVDLRSKGHSPSDIRRLPVDELMSCMDDWISSKV